MQIKILHHFLIKNFIIIMNCCCDGNPIGQLVLFWVMH